MGHPAKVIGPTAELRTNDMIIKSPYPEITIPDTALTPFVLKKAAEIPDKPALIDGANGRVVTYSQLVDSIGRVAASLRQRGFKKGDVFGILSPNNPDYAIAFHAVALLGGTVTTINPLYTEQEIAHQLKDCSARFLVTIPTFMDKHAWRRTTRASKRYSFSAKPKALRHFPRCSSTTDAPNKSQ